MVVPFHVEVHDVLVHELIQVHFAGNDEVVKAFLFERRHPARGERVKVRCPIRAFEPAENDQV